MREVGKLEAFLAGAQVDEPVLALRPDYRALLIAVDGIELGPSNEASEALLHAAEAAARLALADRPVEQVPHVAAWREAYRAFGENKPQRHRNSLEALLRRAHAGLPRVNRLTDVYNAVSVLHGVPLGGEDLDRYLVSRVGSLLVVGDQRGTVSGPPPPSVRRPRRSCTLCPLPPCRVRHPVRTEPAPPKDFRHATLETGAGPCIASRCSRRPASPLA